jgi:hypothetical protein
MVGLLVWSWNQEAPWTSRPKSVTVTTWITLRVTMIYRREDDGWKIVLRQADPIMTPQPIDSIIAKASSASDGHSAGILAFKHNNSLKLSCERYQCALRHAQRAEPSI